MSNNTPSVIEVTTDRQDTLPLRMTSARNGNTYWATLSTKQDGSRYFNKYGVNVTGLSELPSSVTIEGVTVPLKFDLTEKGQRRVRGASKVTIPGVGDKFFSIRITETGPSAYNLSASVNGGGGGGKPAVGLDEL